MTSSLLGNKICKDMKDPTMERSPSSAKLAINALHRKAVLNFILGLTLERSYTIAKPVTSSLLGNKICKDMEDPTLERSPSSAKLVISGLHKRVM